MKAQKRTVAADTWKARHFSHGTRTLRNLSTDPAGSSEASYCASKNGRPLLVLLAIVDSHNAAEAALP